MGGEKEKKEKGGRPPKRSTALPGGKVWIPRPLTCRSTAVCPGCLIDEDILLRGFPDGKGVITNKVKT